VSDELFVEQQRVAFAMFCDENGLSLENGRALAGRLADELMNAADYRATYLPERDA